MALPFACLVYPTSPLVLPTPTNYQVGTASGTLAAGTYKYRITALDGIGRESLPSPEMSVTLGSTGGCNPQWFLVPGAASYNIYGRTAGAELLIANVPGTTNQYIDSGSITPAGAMPVTTPFVEATATPGMYVVPNGKTAHMERVVVSNPSTGNGQIYLSHVQLSGTGGAANRIMAGVTVPPDSQGGPFEWATGLALSAGDFLTGYVTVPGMTLSIYGLVG